MNVQTDLPAPKNLPAILADVALAIGAVGKEGYNEQQRFKFRGIDGVVNAASWHLHDAGVFGPVPHVLTAEYGTVEVGKNRTPMGHARVTVEFTLYGPDGDHIVGSAPGEAMDSGDKATAKAMSVAMRTFLLQALCLPTGDRDPDADAYERSGGDATAPVVDQEGLEGIARDTLVKAAGDLTALRHLWQQVSSSPLEDVRKRPLLDEIAAAAADAKPAEKPAPTDTSADPFSG